MRAPRKGTNRVGSNPSEVRCDTSGPESISVPAGNAEQPLERLSHRPKRNVGVVGEATQAEHLAAAGLYSVEHLCH